MAYKLEIKEEARLDIINGAAWYKDKRENLDKRFVVAVESTIKLILKNPFTYKRSFKNRRGAGVRKFPYLVVYEISGLNVIVYAVFNTWQNPRKKIERIKK